MHTALQPWSSQQKLDLQNIHHIQIEKQSLLLTYVLNIKLSYSIINAQVSVYQVSLMTACSNASSKFQLLGTYHIHALVRQNELPRTSVYWLIFTQQTGTKRFR
jgi:hypothetical protein